MIIVLNCNLDLFHRESTEKKAKLHVGGKVLYQPLHLNISMHIEENLFNPLTPISDQDRISPNNINTISSRQEMRTKKNINLGDY